jgi:hypothetical protein
LSDPSISHDDNRTARFKNSFHKKNWQKEIAACCCDAVIRGDQQPD